MREREEEPAVPHECHITSSCLHSFVVGARRKCSLPRDRSVTRAAQGVADHAQTIDNHLVRARRRFVLQFDGGKLEHGLHLPRLKVDESIPRESARLVNASGRGHRRLESRDDQPLFSTMTTAATSTYHSRRRLVGRDIFSLTRCRRFHLDWPLGIDLHRRRPHILPVVLSSEGTSSAGCQGHLILGSQRQASSSGGSQSRTTLPEKVHCPRSRPQRVRALRVGSDKGWC
jgi:hypothetical protein